MHDTTALANAILSHHAATFAGFAPEPVPTPTSQDPVYLAALQACSQLGFIPHDAECLARAWQARALREFAQLVSGGLPRTWTVPWIDSWRLGETPTLPDSPRAVRRLVDELHAILEPGAAGTAN